ncbi:MAG: hypothetical protein L6R42_004593 [Xanthoria sp. 1 TBL-2021]|nr:MAG: hypothetical protein L6R42_004593 [Xanthoria sp. 1 TBL-2021]
MATGIETAGLILAAFPLVISALEHYENGFQVIREWIRFKGEFAAFLNALIRQRIFFRQNIEDLLGPIVASEYEMSVLLDHPGGKAWADETLHARLRQRLPGKYEYESYATTVSYIMETLHKLKDKLKIVEDRPLWIEHASSSGRLKLEYELKRITYTLSRKRRDKLMSQLERHNNEIQTLLGNSERLEPMRKKRRSPITKYFHQIRDHAHNLHAALTHAWRCDDSPTHTAKLLLEKRVRPDEDGGHEIEDPTSIKFNVLFAHVGERMSDTSTTCSSSDWCAAKIELMDIEPKDERRESLPSIKGDPRSLADSTSQHSSNAPSLGTTSSGTGDRRVSFVTSMTEPTTISLCDGASEISDLCSTLRSRSSSQSSLGYFRDAHHRRYILTLAGPPQDKLADIQNIITLEGVLGKKNSAVGQAILPRRSRLAVAVTLAHSMLQLHTGPWLHESWGKKDVYFVQDQKDIIYVEQPFLVRQISATDAESAVTTKTTSRGCNTSLLSLGILILELWFNERIEAQPFYKQYQDQDGNDNEYTAFNAAQKWQEQAMEEAGLDLHNPTRRCIYCAFGAASQDLEDEELRRAVYSEVVQPLEKLHARFEGSC